MILISSTTCGAMREAAAFERDDPGPDVMPDSRHTPIISHVVVGRRRVLGVDVDMKRTSFTLPEENWLLIVVHIIPSVCLARAHSMS